MHYAGAGEQPYFATLAVTGGRGRPGDRPADTAEWDALVAEVRAHRRERVVVSSEMLGDADDATARRVVGDLGGAGVHVVVTLRPLVKILPSAWQQYVRNQLRAPYEEWLEGMFLTAPYNRPTPTFWRRHSHDELVRRWASVVGPDQVTVVMVDEHDPGLITQAFEDLTGLPHGILEPGTGTVNRSLTPGEVELLRRINVEFYERGWPDALYRTVRDELIRSWRLRTPLPAERRTVTPSWALERAAARGAEAAAAIHELGVRVVGDLDALGATLDGPADEIAAPLLPADVAFDAIRELWQQGRPAADDRVENRPVKTVPATQLLRVLGRRAQTRARRTLSRSA